MTFKKGQVPWNKGKKCPQTSGHKNGMYGRKRLDLVVRNKSLVQREACRKYASNRIISEETRLRMRKASKEVKLRIGWWQKESNPFWKGGIAKVRNKLVSYSKYQAWRNAVLERDGYKCVMCFNECKLVAHHIIQVAEDSSKIVEVDNGITLCKKCHIMTHYPKKRPALCTYNWRTKKWI